MSTPPDGVRAAKAVLRADMRRRLAALTPAQVLDGSSAIVGALRAHPALAGSGAVAIYAPVAAWNEVDISALAVELLAAGRCVAVPRAGSDGPGFARVSNWRADFVKGLSPVPEARPGLGVVDPSEIDAVVVPGLAFDGAGRRLGRGAGYYDRLLAAMPARAWRIGVCFEVQVVPMLVVEAHDAAMDAVVTEQRTIKVRRAGPG